MNVKQCNCYVKKFTVPKNVNIDHMCSYHFFLLLFSC